MAYRPATWYDLTDCYDLVHDPDTRPQADFLEQVLARHAHTGGRQILEPACGSGRLVLAMAQRGYRVTGFDRNQSMLQAAQNKTRSLAHQVRLLEADLEDFPGSGPYDLAYCLISSFRHLLSEKAARNHLIRIHRCLKPGGVYVLGLHLSEYGNTSKSRERWCGKRHGLEVVCNLQSWPPDRKTRLEPQRLRIIVSRNGSVERYEDCYPIRAYSARQLKKLLRSVPGLVHVATYHYDHDIENPGKLFGNRLDVVLVLRKASLFTRRHRKR
jgi:SAM-dependent methyltransferase